MSAVKSMPRDAAERKNAPVYSGVLRYFPDALVAVAQLSKKGNDQHNPGKPLHWDRTKSQDEGDALMRHLLEAGTFDTDGIRHSAKVAWRALALLQKELEQAPKEWVEVPTGQEVDESQHGDWIEADGHPLLHNGTLIEVQFSDGSTTTGQVQDFYWRGGLGAADIRMYRVL
jgi:hypothetical protein